MTHLREILAVLTVCFFACRFLAMTPSIADVDRSGAVDLGDAILAVQGLHYLSHLAPVEETGGGLGVYLLNAVQAFKALAGMKCFSPVPPPKSFSPGASFVALLPITGVTHVFSVMPVPRITASLYQSIDLERSTPPPRSFWFPAD